MVDTHLLMKYFKGLATQDEIKEIQYWLSHDKDGSHRKTYQIAHKTFVGLTLHADALAKPAEPKKRIFSFQTFKPVWKVAAAIILMAVMVYAGRQSVYRDILAMNEKIYVPAGKSMDLTLEDGTILHINSNTEIEYPKIFSRKNRVVKLNSGEVLFDVAKDSTRPFIVENFASEIEVLGTQFNVEAHPDEEMFATVLLEGSVSISSKLSDEKILMSPNDQVIMKDGRLEKTHLDNVSSVTAWTKGVLDISNMPFDQLIRKLENVYGVKIIVEKSDLSDISYQRGKVWISDGIDQVLSIMQLSADFEYIRRGDIIYIR